MFFKTHSNKIILLFVILLGVFFHFESMNEYPMYIHTWAQSDRFAIALNFLWNDFNLLKAETYLMNLQFPSDYLEPKEDSITMVNLPFHEYFIALLMKVFNSREPFIFRSYQFIWSFIGLFSLLKIASQLKLNISNKILLILFVATTPLFVYYQNNFLPSISSFSLCLVAIFWYLKYYKSKKAIYFYFALVLLILASIYRNTFAIQLVALLGLEFLRLIKGNTKLIHVSIAALLTGIAFYLQNAFQMNQVHHYGSVFQYYLSPPENWEHVISITNRIFDRWIFEYFSVAHYMLIGVLILSLIVIRFILKKKSNHNRELTNIALIYPMGALFGCLLFYIVMYPKLYDHDYYILDTLYIPIFLIFLFLLKSLQQHVGKPINISLLVVFCIPAIILANSNLNERRSSPHWDHSTQTVADLNNIETTLDSLNIDRSKKILAIGSDYSNLPFILMNRKGFIVNRRNKHELEEALQWNYDFILLHDRIYKEAYYSAYPDLLGNVKKVFSNGSYTICKLKTQDLAPSLIEFFNTGKNQLLYEQKVDFETESIPLWSNFHRTKEDRYQGKFSSHIKANNLFGLSLKLENILLGNSNTHIVNVTMKVKSTEKLRDLNLVVAVNESEERVFYQASNLKQVYYNRNDWQEISLQYNLPQLKSDHSKLSVYFWNPGKQNAFIDDFVLSIYQ